MRKFEVVERFKEKNIPLPKRETLNSVGYDVTVAEDTVVMPYLYSMNSLSQHINNDRFTEEVVSEIEDLMSNGKQEEATQLDFKTITCTLEEMATYTKRTGVKPTLVSTGLKAKCEENESIELVLRSSTPLKHWLVMANSIGIIDGDYYNNPSNEGEIFFQLINFSPVPILLRKGDKIGQIIFKKFLKTDDDHMTEKKERNGGFGSTNE